MSKDVKKRRDKKITAFDVVIVLLIIGLLATFAYRVYDGIADPGFKKNPQYTLAFVCDEEYNSIARHLEDGEAVYIASTGELLGNLYARKADEPVITVIGGSVDVETDGESSDETVEVPETIYEKVILSGNLMLNADAEAVNVGSYYTVGGINIVNGSVIEVYTEDAVFTLTVASIAPIQ